MKTNLHNTKQGDICCYSPFRGWMLDNWIRRLFQNPKNIFGDYVKEGMTAIDIGCGPGMFTLAMAAIVGDTGTVIAVDIQQEMLDLVRKKAERKGFVSRIRFSPERTRSHWRYGKGRFYPVVLHGSRGARPRCIPAGSPRAPETGWKIPDR